MVRKPQQQSVPQERAALKSDLEQKNARADVALERLRKKASARGHLRLASSISSNKAK